MSRVNNPPFGRGARVFTLEHFPVTVGTSKVKLIKGSRRVEMFSVQAAWSNTRIITIGLSTVALANGFRQLVPGQTFNFEPEGNETSEFVGNGQTVGAIDLAHPVELIDIGLQYAIAEAAGQVLLCTIGMRQPMVPL